VTTFAKFLENSLIKKLGKSGNLFSSINVTNFANFLVENHQILDITKLRILKENPDCNRHSSRE
jgi:hypothetical protein